MPKRYGDDDSRSLEYQALNKKVGANLKSGRMLRQMTQHEMAALLRRSPGWVGMVETGKTGISLLDLDAISKLLDLPKSFFIEDGRIPTPREPRTPRDWFDVFPEDRNLAEALALVHQACLDMPEEFGRFTDTNTAVAHIVLQAVIDKASIRDAMGQGRRRVLVNSN